MRSEDVPEIKKRSWTAKIYGTCYCLMKPDFQWINPYCMESVTDNCDMKTPNLVMPAAGIDAELFRPKCYQIKHHKTMKWDTKEGRQEEGLTVMSTLLCTRGGIITFKVSGQIMLASDEEQLIGFQFTLEQLRACGWEDVSEEELVRLNHAMQRFGVTARESAYMMLVTMLSESGNCTIKLEGGIALEKKMHDMGKEVA